MRVTPPVTLMDLNIISSGAAEPHDPAEYNAATPYVFGDLIKVAADFKRYEYLQPYDAAIVGKTPNVNPYFWRIIGVTETAYNVATTYGLGDTMASLTTHRCYESLTAGNLGNPYPIPPLDINEWWMDVGSTNKWAMFDLNANTQTVLASPLTVVIAPGVRVNTLGLRGMVGESVVISATSVTGGPGTVYGPETKDLVTREVFDALTYYFEPASTRPSTTVFDLPLVTDLNITVTISTASGNVKCGAVVTGTYIYLGTLTQNPENDGLNFSTIDRDTFGTAKLVPRRTAPTLSGTIKCPSYRVNKVMDVRNTLNAIPALWTGIDDPDSDWFDVLSILGVYTKLPLVFTNNRFAEIPFTAEEI